MSQNTHIHFKGSNGNVHLFRSYESDQTNKIKTIKFQF